MDKGGACVWPSLDNPRMAKLLGNPGILDKGGACVWPSLDNPGMAKLLGNPELLGQGVGHVCGHPWTIPGWLVTWESRDTWTRGEHVCGHSWTILGWLSYLGTWEITSHVSASLDITSFRAII